MNLVKQYLMQKLRASEGFEKESFIIPHLKYKKRLMSPNEEGKEGYSPIMGWDKIGPHIGIQHSRKLTQKEYEDLLDSFVPPRELQGLSRQERAKLGATLINTNPEFKKKVKDAILKKVKPKKKG